LGWRETQENQKILSTSGAVEKVEKEALKGRERNIKAGRPGVHHGLELRVAGESMKAKLNARGKKKTT